MEQNTPYTVGLTAFFNNFPTYSKLYGYNLANRPKNHTYQQVFTALSNGTTIISGSDLLVHYISSYGAHHYHKLEISFSNLLKNIPDNSVIELIDYGCGQALASTIFIDYIAKTEKPVRIEKITLIEPSNDAIERGEFHLNFFLQRINQTPHIVLIKKLLDDVDYTELATSSNTIKIHLFSNILDVDGIDLKTLYDNIIKSQAGINFFVCVSPYGPNKNRIVTFSQMFAGNNKHVVPAPSAQIFRKVYNIQTNKWDDSYAISMIQSIFRCDLP